MQFLNFSTIKNYINDNKKIRSSDKAVADLIKRFSETIEDVIVYAKNLALKDRRKTIMPRDVKKAIEKVVGKKDLAWQDTLKEILKKKPAQIGNISKGIESYIRGK